MSDGKQIMLTGKGVKHFQELQEDLTEQRDGLIPSNIEIVRRLLGTVPRDGFLEA